MRRVVSGGFRVRASGPFEFVGSDPTTEPERVPRSATKTTRLARVARLRWLEIGY